MKLSFKFYPKLSTRQFDIMNELSFHTTKLYNTVNYEYHQNGFVSYVTAEKQYKTNWHNEFLHSHTYQHCLKMVEQDWKSYFQALMDYIKHPDKYKGQPEAPKYKNHDKRKNQVIFTNLAVRVKENVLMLSLSKVMQTLFTVKSLNFVLPIRVQKQINMEQIQQVRINWDNSKKQWYLIIIYKKEVKKNPHFTNVMSIDLGLDNLCAITFKDSSEQILIDGRILKMKNSYYNKEIAKYTSIAMKQSKNPKNFKRTKHLNKLQRKRNDYIQDYLHKTSRYLIHLALKKECSTIVIGDLKDIKQNSNLKTFIQIPIQRLVELITYKAELEGIKVIKEKESYTSGVSAIDLEPITKTYYNKSRRIQRGLFSNGQWIINADINGSLNIMRIYMKDNVVPELVKQSRNNGFVDNPIRVRVA